MGGKNPAVGVGLWGDCLRESAVVFIAREDQQKLHNTTMDGMNGICPKKTTPSREPQIARHPERGGQKMVAGT